MAMVDVSDKGIVRRVAEAEGKIFLKRETMDKIMSGDIKKGDVLQVAEVAAINAVKKTPEMLFHCHQLPIESIVCDLQAASDHIHCRTEVIVTAKTGVEMESLVGVTTALLTVWDMVKYLEKDGSGQYTKTSITDIKVVKKTKGE